VIAPERRIGRIRGDAAGPTLIVTAAIHGNETAGITAARRLLARLDAHRTEVRGELVVLAGNLAAIAAGKRHVVKDLNRVWTTEKVDALRGRDASTDDSEDAEQRALLAEIDRAIDGARGSVFHVDLHTTSAAGHPFGIYDADAQESFALAFPLTTIRGLAAALAGVLSSYLDERGVIALAVEGGQHADPATIDHLAATLTIALVAAGLVDESAMPGLDEARAHLDRVRGEIPRAMKVVARYAIVPSDAFVMAPGFANIAPVVRGQLLAKDARGAIHAPADGYVILPLYQGQGDDGFFFGQEARRGD
jgi:succinylglutamate desuccinylase